MPQRPPPLRSRIWRDSFAFEAAADRLEAELEARHLPHGSVLDPIFASPQSDEIVRYTRGGDSAIWTGHLLAAESFRFAVTGEAEALGEVREILATLSNWLEIAGSDVLPRVALPADSPWAAGVAAEEAHHGVHTGALDGEEWIWVDNTSRDQYLGVFFGLSVAYELISEPDVRASVRQIVTRLLDGLLRNHWVVVRPDGSIATIFWHRVDQRLALLQVGRQVNEEQFAEAYRTERLLGSSGVAGPIAFETLDEHNSYFKFNLVAIAMYNLLRLEAPGEPRDRYLEAYEIFRRAVEDHGNVHFNLIDRALRGPDPRRDLETIQLLKAWLERPRRDFFVDWRGRVAACGENRACEPLPVAGRVMTDFLWQRSPFQLSGGGNGFIESAGIDFLLPYWMGRYYGAIPPDRDEP